MTPTIITIVCQLILIAAVHIAYFEFPVVYVRLVSEDNWGEFSTSISFLIAAALFAICSRANRETFARYWYLLLVAACFLLGMEEISWGQRIFGFETPEALGEVNLQNETTIHNIEWLSPEATAYRALALICVLFGFLVPLARERTMFISSLVKRLHLPLPRLHISPMFLAAGYHLGISNLHNTAGEIGELFLSLSMVSMAADHAIAMLPRTAASRHMARAYWVGLPVTVLLWVLSFLLVLPWLIVSAYHGNSLPFLNGLITGQATHDVDFYLSKGYEIGWSILGFILITAILALPFVLAVTSARSPAPSFAALIRNLTVPLVLFVAIAMGILLTQLAGRPELFRADLKWMATGDYTEAGLYRQGLDIIAYLESTSAGDSSQYLYHRATLLSQLGREQEAADAIRRGLERRFSKLESDPTSPETLNKIGDFYDLGGDRESAIKFWHQAIEASEDSMSSALSERELTRLHLWRAWAFEKIGEPGNAIMEFLLASKYCRLKQDAVLIEKGVAKNLAACNSSSSPKPQPNWVKIEEMRDQVQATGSLVAWCRN